MRDVDRARAAIFDFGGVMTEPIFRRPVGLPREYVDLARYFLTESLAAYGDRQGDHDLHRLETGHLGETEFFARLCGRFAESGGPGLDPLAARDAILQSGIVACDAMVDAVRDVRAGGYRTALLTNNVKEWGPQWRPVVPLDELFDVVVDSSAVGLRKPDPAIYHLTCERLEVEPPACMFVDDLQVNVDAAAALGMDTILCSDPVVAAGEVRTRLLGGSAMGATP